MELESDIRDRVILLGGTVAGVDCPNCAFESRDIEPDPFAVTDVTCPECDTTILTEDQKSQLRRSGKLRSVSD